MRKVDIEIKMRLICTVDEGTSIHDIVDEIEVNFSGVMDSANIENVEIIDYKVVDSK